MVRIWKLFVFLALSQVFLIAGLEAQTAEEYESQYAKNITLEEINGVYIPEDSYDAMTQLDLLSDAAAREKMLDITEDEAARRLFFALGKWMLVNWNLYEGSRLSHHLKQLGISDPEDMARFLIVSYHRHLRKVDLELASRAEIILQARKKEQEEANKKKKRIN